MILGISVQDELFFIEQFMYSQDAVLVSGYISVYGNVIGCNDLFVQEWITNYL